MGTVTIKIKSKAGEDIVEIDEELWEQFTSIAKKSDVPVEELFRVTLQRYLDEPHLYPAQWYRQLLPMEIRTETSAYEITRTGTQFHLVKILVKEGSVSRVDAGREFTSEAKDIFINKAGGLEFGPMNTSPVENVDELRKWLSENGIKQAPLPGVEPTGFGCALCGLIAGPAPGGVLPDGWVERKFEQGSHYLCPDCKDEQICRVCGCSEHNPCDGGCYWVQEDLCSSCAEAKRSLALMFNGIVTVHYGEEIPLLDGEVRICPEAGVFKKSIIRRELPDGSLSTTEWNGQVSVKVGDYVLMDSETGQISVELKSYEVMVGAGLVVTQGSSPRVAISRALQEQYANPSRFKGADCKLDYQLKVGQTLVIKCTRLA